MVGAARIVALSSCVRIVRVRGMAFAAMGGASVELATLDTHAIFPSSPVRTGVAPMGHALQRTTQSVIATRGGLAPAVRSLRRSARTVAMVMERAWVALARAMRLSLVMRARIAALSLHCFRERSETMQLEIQLRV